MNLAFAYVFFSDGGLGLGTPIKVRGVVLRRSPLREQDEMVTLFTRLMGKLHCFSFGSRSASSQRGYRLGEPYWYEFRLRRSRQGLCLEGIEKVLSIGRADRPQFRHHWRSVCNLLDKAIPLGAFEADLFQFCSVISQRALVQKPLLFQQFLFHYGLLYLLGLFPFFDKACYDGSGASDFAGAAEPNPKASSASVVGRDDYIQPLQTRSRSAVGDVSPNPEELQRLFGLGTESLQLLNHFGQHFSNTLPYFLSVHDLLAEGWGAGAGQFRRLVQMGKTLCQPL